MAASQRWKRWQLAGVAVRVLLFVLKVDIEAARSPILTTWRAPYIEVSHSPTIPVYSR